MIILPETSLEEFLAAKGDERELENPLFSNIKCRSTNNYMHEGDENLGHKRLVETEKTFVKSYLAATTAEAPEDSKGEIIDAGDVEGGVYAQGIREFHWPDQFDGPKFHTMVRFFLL